MKVTFASSPAPGRRTEHARAGTTTRRKRHDDATAALCTFAAER
ncbi:hypothetical protein ACQP00_25625 [Dactylosporangium sp. CS-047395]